MAHYVHEYTYDFEELPLVYERQKSGATLRAGLVDGCARIRVTTPESYDIVAIGLTSYSDYGKRTVHWLDAEEPLYLMILHRLENEWRNIVETRNNTEFVTLDSLAWGGTHLRRTR